MNANQGHGDAPFSTLKAARAIFGEKNVRFYGGGIPQVFCDGETPSMERLRRLLLWGCDCGDSSRSDRTGAKRRL